MSQGKKKNNQSNFSCGAFSSMHKALIQSQVLKEKKKKKLNISQISLKAIVTIINNEVS